MNLCMRLWVLPIFVFVLLGSSLLWSNSKVDGDWQQVAGDHLPQLEKALREVAGWARPHLLWLLSNMPEADLQSLDADFLREHVEGAVQAWKETPWSASIPESIFRDAILPYANVNERRDAWRQDFRDRFLPLVKEAGSASEATAILNSKIFNLVGVKYSTKRPKADQSPYESMEAGLASCTGLSILLIDACRAVGIPARFVGTPLWSDNSGNHSWIEIWDEGWHFTGAAEPTGKDLNRGWFSGRASGAATGDPRNAIYAVSWSSNSHHFPMVWKPGDTSVGAIDITFRYAQKDEEIAADRSRLFVQVRDGESKERVEAQVWLLPAQGTVEKGISRVERFDANDHLPVMLNRGQGYLLYAQSGDRFAIAQGQSGQAEETITLELPAASDPDNPSRAVSALKAMLTSQPSSLEEVSELAISRVALDKHQANEAARSIWQAYAANLIRTRAEEMESKVIPVGKLKMPFDFKVFGDPTPSGRSLYISLHGGGGAPAAVNDQQWENQKRLYEPKEGIYLAPRAPTNTWNLWHQGHIDKAFDRLIANMIAFHQVNPDRVYVLGYSAGGDGVYQLAPRMADRWAAAAMMAGHPNDARPESLRNLPFTLHMGAKDAPYNRNGQAEIWKGLLSDLKKADREGYDHWVEIYPDKGHWMDREDRQAIPWLASKVRKLRSRKIVWKQDDVVHPRFYWLFDPTPTGRSRVDALLDGQKITLNTSEDHDTLSLRLDDSMVDLSQPLVITINDNPPQTVAAQRNIQTLVKTMSERGDPAGMFSSEVMVEISKTANPQD